jgi:O-antigen/teichoic acid export membrane protein
MTPVSTKQIASSTLWQVASQAAMAVLSILTVKFVAIGLSKELAGNYNSVYGFLQIFGIIADFSLYAVAVREVSRATDKPRMMGALVILRALILVLSLASALIIVWIAPAWRGTPFPIGVTIASLVPFFTLLAGIQRTIFQVSYKMHFVFVAEVAQRVLTVLMIGAVIMMGIRGSADVRIYQYFLLAGGVSAGLLFAISTYYANRLMRIKLAWDGALLKDLFWKSAPYGAAFMCTALYRQFDVTLITILRPDYDLQNAYYGFALRATEVAYLFPTFLLNSTLPILSKRDADGEDTRDFVGKIFFAVFLLSITAFMFALIWARPVMQLLTTETYLSTATLPGSDTALKLLSLSMLLNGMVLFSYYSMLTRHAWRPLVTSLALGAVLSVGLNFFLIPRLGFVGASYASIGTHIFLAAVLLPQALKILPMRIGVIQIYQWIAYIVLLGGWLVLLRPFLTNEFLTIGALVISTLWIGAIAFITRIHKTLRLN